MLRGAGHRVRARAPAAGAQRAWKSWRGESWQPQSPIWGLVSHSLHPHQVQGRLWAGRTESKFTHEQPTSTSYPARAEEPLSLSPPDGTVLIITYLFKREVSGKVVCILHFFLTVKARLMFAFLQTCALCLIFQEPSRCKNALSNSHVSLENFYQKHRSNLVGKVRYLPKTGCLSLNLESSCA